MTAIDPVLQSPRPTPAPRLAPWVEADLRVGDHDARYRIAGSGRLVLALSRQLDAAFLGHCEWLARSARVVVPTLRGASATCEAWLLGLVDLFGAGEVTLLADRTAAIEALALALASPERVTGMEFVWNGASPRQAAEAVLLPAFGRCLVSVAVAGYIDP